MQEKNAREQEQPTSALRICYRLPFRYLTISASLDFIAFHFSRTHRNLTMKLLSRSQELDMQESISSLDASLLAMYDEKEGMQEPLGYPQRHLMRNPATHHVASPVQQYYDSGL
jgi:uncharacterized protein YlxW (UPF0749 family)